MKDLALMQLDRDQQAIEVSASVTTWSASIRSWVSQGGPATEEYSDFMQLLAQIDDARREHKLTDDQVAAFRLAFGDALGPHTMQGRSLLKAYGYAGDFDLIDQIYCGAVSSDPMLRRWDEFFHAQPAAKAVRNRKTYFKTLVEQHLASGVGRELQVLNVGSGPGRDVAEFLTESPHAPVHVTCVDLDARAIAYASELCKAWTNRVSFIQANAARLRLSRRFDLVWSAGLFDYFNDRGFAHLLKRLAAHVRRDGGEVVIGNFSASNPTLAYQELCGDWHLNHRSAEVLVGIARQACGPSVEIAVEREPEGVNLFLRVRVVGDATSLTQGNAI